jgi:hypothetical protein
MALPRNRFNARPLISAVETAKPAEEKKFVTSRRMEKPLKLRDGTRF